MATEEKTFYEDNHIRITNLRLNFYNETIPIDKITHTECRMKVVNLVVAFICLLLSLPAMMLGKLGVTIIVVMFIWVWKMYSSYISLWVTVDDKPIKIKQTSIAHGKKLHAIEDALKAAIQDNLVIQEEEGGFPYTETMVFKQKMRALSED